MEASLLVTGLLLLLEGAAMAWAGLHLWRRQVSPVYSFSWAGFVAWWIGTAISSVVTFVRHVMLIAGADEPQAHLMLLLVALLTSFIGTAGLLVYLFTLVQGTRTWHRIWYAVASLLFVQNVVLLSAAQPVRVVINGATVGLEYANGFPVAISIAALPHVLLPLVLLGIIAWSARNSTMGPRALRMAALMGGWMIAKSALTGGALGALPAGVTWVVRLAAVVAALALVQYAYLPPATESE